MTIEGRQRKEAPPGGSARMREGAPRVAESTQTPRENTSPVRSDNGGPPKVNWLQHLKDKLAGRVPGSSEAHRSHSREEYSGGLSSPVRQPAQEVLSDIRTVPLPNRLELQPPGATVTPSPQSVRGSRAPLSNEPGRSSSRNNYPRPAQTASAFSQVEQRPQGTSPSALEQPEGKRLSPATDHASFGRPNMRHTGRWPASPQPDQGSNVRRVPPAAWKPGTDEGNRAPIQARKKLDLMTDSGTFSQPALLTILPLTPPNPPRSVDATGIAGDPWPELPEDLFSAAEYPGQFLRTWQHISALDIEQRGGR